MSDTTGLRMVEFREDPAYIERRSTFDRWGNERTVAAGGVVICTVAGYLAATDNRPLLCGMYSMCATLWAAVLCGAWRE